MKRFYPSAVSVAVPLVGMLLLVSDGFGQGMVNDGAKVNLTSGTYLTIESGGFKNQTNGGNVGQVTNDQGFIVLDGTWENNSASNVFGATPTINTGGTVRLNGAAVQDIQGSQETNFFHLQALGGGDKRLDAVDANVYGILTMTSTDVDLNRRNLTLENASTGAMSYFAGGLVAETGPSVGMGKLEWNIGNTNTGSYVVPFKTAGGTSVPFTYNIVDAGTPSGGTPDTYKRFTTYVTNPTNTDFPPNVTHITADDFVDNSLKVVDRFWYIENDVDGNYAFNTIPEVNYTFTYATAEHAAPNTITEANLVAQRFNPSPANGGTGVGNGTWLDWLYSPTAVVGSNTVTLNLGLDQSNSTASIIDYYPAWTLVDNSDPLPIELVRFVGECLGEGKIELSWTTWTETNNDFFTLERSNNGVDFEVVDVIAGAGNSNQPISYSLIDDMPYGGTSYYRLKDTDYEGKSSYSDVIAVTCGADGNDFEFVNAYEINNTELMLEFTAADNEDFTVLLFDASGRLILNKLGSAIEGMNKVRLNVTDLARGIYIINLSNGKRVFNKRVMLK